LITGETGTGKELIAVALQKNSKRADQVFITLNCAALSQSLMESALFGHRKGAFTDAVVDTPGIFEAADGGTLFLDEINSLPLDMQAKLLRFVDTGEYLPVGSVKTCTADVRIIAATNTPIDELIKAGEFRRDLYYRLNVVTLELPPLRDRAQDIDLLLHHYMGFFAAKHRLRTPSFKPEALAALEAYPWPGNIRELRNLCENLIISRFRRTIELKDLPLEYREGKGGYKAIYFDLPKLGLDWYQLERQLILQALEKTDGNCREAALLLGLSRDALYYRVKKYKLTAG
jgi:DNA-binding NtrC family response regulator